MPKLNTSFLAASCIFIKQLHYHLAEMERIAGHKQLCNVHGKPAWMGPRKPARAGASKNSWKRQSTWKKSTDGIHCESQRRWTVQSGYGVCESALPDEQERREQCRGHFCFPQRLADVLILTETYGGISAENLFHFYWKACENNTS